ncbi:MAG: hypothetical protein IKK47_01235 [Ruminococcus sp.]|nr:hypothetical protein [Ruminococcus sp.]
MEQIKSSVIAVCTVSAAICIIESLVSGTRLKNQMKMILNLVLISAAAAPFLKDGLDFDFSGFSLNHSLDYSHSQDMYNEELRRQTSYNVSSVLLQQINAAGIQCEKIETEVNISEDGSISITKVTLKTDNFKDAAEIVRSSLGNETEVVNENI